MCGIAGIIQQHSTYDASAVRAMSSALKHRGPDGEGFWQDQNGKVLFGHRRLAVIDLSDAAAQPMHFTSPKNGNKLVIVYNGELYNYIELRKLLISEGYTFKTQSDTEVILAAYDCWKEDCLDQFDGMFAFAIWDGEANELFAARDRFGEKPFFYCLQNGALLFASEMKALWAAGVPRVANRQMLFNFITIGYTGNPLRPEETFFEGISKLPPACFLYYNAGSGELEIEKYWEIDPGDQHNKTSDAEATEQFTSLLHSSVRRRLRSDVACGSSLSGGLDSSAIVAMISNVSHHHKHDETLGFSGVFTASFPGFEKDETAYAKIVANHFNLSHYTTEVSADALPDYWEKFMYYQEEPVTSASPLAQFLVFGLAREKGVTVLLDGQGADEMLAGYHKYYKWYWQELFRKRKLLRSGELNAAKKLGVSENFTVKNVLASLLPDLATVFLERQYLFHALSHPDLTREFIRLQSREAYYTTPEISGLNGVLAFNMFQNGLEELLRYADRNSMAHGREIRLPFLDHQLVEFVFSLPSDFKIRKGWTKWLLRKSMEKSLPAEIIWRRDKTGFEPPQRKWLLQPRMQEKIMQAREKLVGEKVLDKSVLQKPVDSFSAYDKENYDWRYLAAAELF